MEIVQNRFAFFANFAETIQELPEEKRAKAYQAICEYGIYGILPDDESLRMICFIARTSIFKEDGRKNNGGNHNPTGRNQHSAKEEVKVGQSGQSWSKLVKVGQSLSETEAETETEIKENKTNVLSKKKTTIDWDFVITRWNDIANRYSRPQIKTLTAERKKRFEKRIEEYNGTIEKLFEEIEYRIATSLLLQGQKINQYGEKENTDWKGCHFDFICQPQSFARLLEGVYGDKGLEKQYDIKRQMATLQEGENK